MHRALDTRADTRPAAINCQRPPVNRSMSLFLCLWYRSPCSRSFSPRFGAARANHKFTAASLDRYKAGRSRNRRKNSRASCVMSKALRRSQTKSSWLSMLWLVKKRPSWRVSSRTTRSTNILNSRSMGIPVVVQPFCPPWITETNQVHWYWRKKSLIRNLPTQTVSGRIRYGDMRRWPEKASLRIWETLPWTRERCGKYSISRLHWSVRPSSKHGANGRSAQDASRPTTQLWRTLRLMNVLLVNVRSSMTPAERENPDLQIQAVVVGLLLVQGNSFVEVTNSSRTFNQAKQRCKASSLAIEQDDETNGPTK